MESLPSAPPVRHGSCKLAMFINSDEYVLKRVRPSEKGAVVWRLRKIASGAVYSVAKARGVVACSCPDASYRGAVCKHQRALVAAGLLSGRKSRKAVSHA